MKIKDLKELYFQQLLEATLIDINYKIPNNLRKLLIHKDYNCIGDDDLTDCEHNAELREVLLSLLREIT